MRGIKTVVVAVVIVTLVFLPFTIVLFSRKKSANFVYKQKICLYCVTFFSKVKH